MIRLRLISLYAYLLFVFLIKQAHALDTKSLGDVLEKSDSKCSLTLNVIGKPTRSSIGDLDIMSIHAPDNTNTQVRISVERILPQRFVVNRSVSIALLKLGFFATVDIPCPVKTEDYLVMICTDPESSGSCFGKQAVDMSKVAANLKPQEASKSFVYYTNFFTLTEPSTINLFPNLYSDSQLGELREYFERHSYSEQRASEVVTTIIRPYTMKTTSLPLRISDKSLMIELPYFSR